MRKPKETKRCPRCGVKVPIAQEKCPYCNLVYERLRLVTNKSAKEALKKGYKHKVIQYAVLPPDISRLRLILYCLLFGTLGVHRYYVGKIKSALFFTFSFIALVAANVIFFFQLSPLYILGYFLAFPIAFNMLFWMVDFFGILFKKFKVPVSIPEDFAVNGEYGGVLDVVRKIDNSVDAAKRKKIRKEVRREFENDNKVDVVDVEPSDVDGAGVIDAEEQPKEEPKKVTVFDPRTINRGSGGKKKKKRKK